MKRILLNGLGPKDSITYNGKIYKNGAAVDMEASHAAAYLNSHLAVVVESEQEVIAQQKLEKKNAATRERIKKEAAKEVENNG